MRRAAPAGAPPGCGCSCARTSTAGSSPAWSTCRATATPPRPAADGGDPARGVRRRVGVDYTARVTESVLARLHFVVRVPTGPSRAGDVDADDARGAARRGDPVVGRRLRRRAGRRSAARSTAAALLRALRRRVPRGYKEDFPAAHGGRRTSASSRRWTTPAPVALQPVRSRRAPRAASAGSRSTASGEPISLSHGAAGAAAARRRGRRRAAVRARARRRRAGRGSTTSGCGCRPARRRRWPTSRERVRGRLRRGLARRGRVRRLQRAGPARPG